ncbi:MAG: calcium/sodium antiporter [Euryarchaeota archaeon]|nr:calcium/sodium antiporter [Euryarchaeota archaeon]
MLMELLTLILSAVFLAYSSDWFTGGASRLAKAVGVSEFLIGVTVVAIGTSLPEIVVSVYAAYTGNPELAAGNIVGSNITNVALVLGAACIVSPIVIDRSIYRDVKIHVLILAIVSCYFLYAERVTWMAGLLLVIVYGWYIRDGYTRHRSTHPVPEIGDNRKDIVRPLGQTIAGGLGVFVACNFLVDAAVGIASELGISTTVIGLTLVALGTSLPELAVSITAARKRWGMMVLGNVIGSNIANILLALGLGAGLCTIPLEDAIVDNIVLMVFLAMAMVVFVRYRGVFDRRVGILFIMVYVAFIAMIFM